MDTTWRLGSIGVLAVMLAIGGSATELRPSPPMPGRVAAVAARGGALAGTGVARCQTARLRGVIGGQNGAAGSIITTLVLRNAGSRACALRGYPGLSLVDTAHRQIGRPAIWVPGVVGTVVLPAGGAASTLVRTLNPGTGTTNCLPPSAALRIYPPNERTPLYVPARLSECLSVLEVKPMVAGTNGE